MRGELHLLDPKLVLPLVHALTCDTELESDLWARDLCLEHLDEARELRFAVSANEVLSNGSSYLAWGASGHEIVVQAAT